MSTTTESARLPRLKWVLRKLVSLFIIYAALGSIYQSIRADNILAVVLYVLLGIGGFYLLSNW
ncbi:hypothetical protein LPA44_03710 [Halobacterium sp. KA-4]|jgi:hypothetical protein|uniref:hypothetical protein n=1 Tax=Halobacterium sp. KA-4 TaxID=2896367 RepID=UPI001E3A97D9|nr:hypothetical protein [Halobacterium sp. KA-4]MCD2199005.1 hypothetical protein [Halobacterium sp. KA-4]